MSFTGSGALVLNEFGEALLELLDERGMSVQDLSDALRESPWLGGPGRGPAAGLLLACMTDAGDLANHATPSFLVGVGEALDLDTDEIEQMLWAYYKVAERLAHGV